MDDPSDSDDDYVTFGDIETQHMRLSLHAADHIIRLKRGHNQDSDIALASTRAIAYLLFLDLQRALERGEGKYLHSAEKAMCFEKSITKDMLS